MTESKTPSTPTAKVGNLTRDPELRFSKSGTAVCSFSIAHKPYRPKGQPEAETVYYECVAFGSLAENAAQVLLKGDRVVVVGRGEIERWTGKDGVERSTKKIVADGLGPDLRFTTTEIHRSERHQPDYTNEEPF